MIDEESVARILANQEVPASDFMMMQQAIQQSVDALVKEAFGFVDGYAGLLVTKATDTSVQVATGRYYKNGPRYRLAEASTQDMLPHLPQVGNKRVVSVTISGALIDTESGTRRFVTDATVSPPITEPRPTETRTRRVVVVTLVPGIQGTAPLNPNIPADVLEIARVTLSETGIVGTPVMVIDKAITSVSATQAELDALQDQVELFEAELASLRSDLAGLADDVNSKPSRVEFRHLTHKVARLNEDADIPDTHIGIGMDRFENLNESDTAAAGYDVKVDFGGLRFPDEAVVNELVALLNPTDPKITKAATGLMLPVYTSKVGLKVASQTGTIRPLDNTQNVGWPLNRNRLSPVFIYYGAGQNREEIEAELASATSVRMFDPAANAFTTIDLKAKNLVLRMAFFAPGYVKVRFDDPYPDLPAYKTLANTAGSAIAQTFLNAQLGWMTAFEFAVTEKGADGPIHVAICRLKPDGTPDLDNCHGVDQVAFDDIKVWPEWTRCTLSRPLLCNQGVRLAAVLITQGGHVLGTANVKRNMRGALMSAPDGARFTAVQDVDLTCRMLYATFANPRTVVELEAAELAGGIKNIDLLFLGHEPNGTDLVLQAQIGGVWRPLDHTDLTALNAGPNLIPLRFVFKGSETVMPGIDMDNARILGFRPKTAFTHISTARTLSAPSTDIRVIVDVIDFDDAKHDLTISLLSGALYDTPEAADSIALMPAHAQPRDPRRKRYRALFTPAVGLDDFKIKIVGAATTANDGYAVARRVDVAI